MSDRRSFSSRYGGARPTRRPPSAIAGCHRFPRKPRDITIYNQLWPLRHLRDCPGKAHGNDDECGAQQRDCGEVGEHLFGPNRCRFAARTQRALASLFSANGADAAVLDWRSVSVILRAAPPQDLAAVRQTIWIGTATGYSAHAVLHFSPRHFYELPGGAVRVGPAVGRLLFRPHAGRGRNPRELVVVMLRPVPARRPAALAIRRAQSLRCAAQAP